MKVSVTRQIEISELIPGDKATMNIAVVKQWAKVDELVPGCRFFWPAANRWCFVFGIEDDIYCEIQVVE